MNSREWEKQIYPILGQYHVWEGPPLSEYTFIKAKKNMYSAGFYVYEGGYIMEYAEGRYVRRAYFNRRTVDGYAVVYVPDNGKFIPILVSAHEFPSQMIVEISEIIGRDEDDRLCNGVDGIWHTN